MSQDRAEVHRLREIERDIARGAIKTPEQVAAALERMPACQPAPRPPRIVVFDDGYDGVTIQRSPDGDA